MAAFSGKQGKVSFAGTAVSAVTAWSIDATADVVDTSVMVSSAHTVATHWKPYLAGFNDWTATIECLVDDGGLDPDLDTDFAQDTDGIAVILYAGMVSTDQQEGATVRKYSGNGMITGIAISTDKNDVAKITYSVQGSGTLTEAASNAT